VVHRRARDIRVRNIKQAADDFRDTFSHLRNSHHGCTRTRLNTVFTRPCLYLVAHKTCILYIMVNIGIKCLALVLSV
jgi:hypothetical protein